MMRRARWSTHGALPVVLVTLVASACSEVVEPRNTLHEELSPRTAETTAGGASSAPVVTAVSGPTDPVAVNTLVSVSVSFTDEQTTDQHSVRIHWGDGASSVAEVSEAGGSGTASAIHSYAVAGIYAVVAVVTDNGGLEGTGRYEYVTAFNPEGQWVAGNGAINSPVGACTWSGCATDGSTIGTAMFGFSSKYANGATTPSGNTRFRFRAGDLSFSSTAYQWLVVSGARAQYKGSGQINGGGDYGFMLTAIDGDETGGSGVDRFRIKVWDRGTDEVVYDNQRGAADDAEPSTALTRGKITIHSSGRNNAPAVTITSPANESVHLLGTAVTLNASVSDIEDGDVSASVVWTSDLDGIVGSGASVSAPLSAGTHTVTATATDSKGLSGSSSIAVVINAPPAVSITSPANGATLAQAASIDFAASATDPEDGARTGTAVVWTSDLDGQIGTGAAFRSNALSVGTHAIEVTVTDSRGAMASASISITVENMAPVVSISAPASGTVFAEGDAVTFTAAASDAGRDISAMIAWSSNLDGALGAGASLSVSTLTGGAHTITASVVDPDDATVTGSTSVTIAIEAATTPTLGSNVEGTLAPGTTAVYPFDVAAGTVINVAFGSAAGTPYGTVTLRLLDPSGTVLASAFNRSTEYFELGIRRLATEGTHTVEVVASADASTAAYKIGIAHIEDPAPVTLASPYVTQDGGVRVLGDHQFYRFTAEAGDRLRLGLLTDTVNAYLRLRRPGTGDFFQRTQLLAIETHGGISDHYTTQSSIFTVPEAGEYVLQLDPSRGGYYSLARGGFTIYVARPAVTPITLGSATPGTIERDLDVFPSYRRYSFTGTAGTLINTAYTTTSGHRMLIHVFGPDGAALTSWPGYWPRYYSESGVVSLLTDGTYTIELHPVDLPASSAPYTLGLSRIDPPTPISLATPFVEATGSLDVPGARRYFRFQGNLDEIVNVSAHATTLNLYLGLYGPGTQPFYQRPVIRKDVRVLPQGNVWRDNAEIGRRHLSATGEYIIEVKQAALSGIGSNTGSFTIRSFLPQLAGVGLDTQTSGTISPLFEIQRYSLELPQSQRVIIHTRHNLSNDSYHYTHLYNSAGSQLTYQRSFIGANGHHEIARVLDAGVYWIEQNPPGPGTGDVAFTVATIEDPLSLTVGAAAVAGEIDVAGERDYYTFVGTAAQTVTVEAVVPTGSALEAVVKVYQLDASGDFTREPSYPMVRSLISPTKPGTWTISLPSDGTYVVQVDGYDAADASAGGYTVLVR